MTCSDGKNDYMRKMANKLDLRTENDGKSKTLIMNEIKIKDLDKWSGVKAKDVKETDYSVRDDS